MPALPRPKGRIVKYRNVILIVADLTAEADDAHKLQVGCHLSFMGVSVTFVVKAFLT